MSLNYSQNPLLLPVSKLSINKDLIVKIFWGKATIWWLLLKVTRREKSISLGTISEWFSWKTKSRRQNPIMLWPSSQLERRLFIFSWVNFNCDPFLSLTNYALLFLGKMFCFSQLLYVQPRAKCKLAAFGTIKP